MEVGSLACVVCGSMLILTGLGSVGSEKVVHPTGAGGIGEGECAGGAESAESAGLRDWFKNAERIGR